MTAHPLKFSTFTMATVPLGTWSHLYPLANNTRPWNCTAISLRLSSLQCFDAHEVPRPHFVLPVYTAVLSSGVRFMSSVGTFALSTSLFSLHFLSWRPAIGRGRSCPAKMSTLHINISPLYKHLLVGHGVGVLRLSGTGHLDSGQRSLQHTFRWFLRERKAAHMEDMLSQRLVITIEASITAHNITILVQCNTLYVYI